MARQNIGTRDVASAIVNMRPQLRANVVVGGVFQLVCHDRYGNLKWYDTAKNLVTNAGLQHMGNVAFRASSQTATWYVGLMDDTPVVTAASTLAAPGGFTEFTEYADNRKEWVEVQSSNSWVNSGTSADFVINGAGGGVGGAFICAAATGTAAILFCGAALTGGNRVVATADTVAVTYTVALADA